MQMLSLIWGILAFLGMGVGLLPCFGALNWLTIPFAGVGLIVSIVALVTGQSAKKGMSIAGIVLCGVAIVFGLVRLIVGGGLI
jgi:hypothetical protein